MTEPSISSFQDLLVERIRKQPAFARGVFHDAMQLMIGGEVGPGRLLLRDYINGTVGFKALASATKINEKSLMRMFGPDGNPQANNLFLVIQALQELSARNLKVSVSESRRRPIRSAKPQRTGIRG